MMSNWSQSMPKTRYVMDSLLLVFFVLANVPQISLVFHEWISLVFIIPFVVHLLLHWNWSMTVPRRFFKGFSAEIRFNVIFDTVLYLLMVFVIGSGFLASEVLLPMFGEFRAQPFWTEAHHQYSNLLMAMVGIHLGMHWSWIKQTTRAIFQKQSGSEPLAGIEK